MRVDIFKHGNPCDELVYAVDHKGEVESNLDPQVLAEVHDALIAETNRVSQLIAAVGIKPDYTTATTAVFGRVVDLYGCVFVNGKQYATGCSYGSSMAFQTCGDVVEMLDPVTMSWVELQPTPLAITA
ncbi:MULTISPECIES: hypothetical protein [unclassified Maridesulfovibrio]|uniref:hypothetical protein n=1 Tax=unclassified Maridesulfovibrio TaxID=2794999 RepID=UPI003B3CCF02